MELYICDKAGDNESCNHCTNRIPQSLETIKSISELYINPNLNFCALRNIPVKAIPYKNEEKKMEKQEYKPLKSNISMMTMADAGINCPDFNEACKEWLDKDYGLKTALSWADFISIAEKHNGISTLIAKGFIEKVEPEVNLKFELKDKVDRFTVVCQGYNIASFYKNGKGIYLVEGLDEKIDGLQIENDHIKIS